VISATSLENRLWDLIHKGNPSVQDFQKERLAMVEEQLRRRNIFDGRVLQAMSKVPRHSFVSTDYQSAAYEDRPLSIGEGQTISQPYMVAIMTQSLELKGKERVLEIGTGSGYQTAILAELSQFVFTVERIPALMQKAQWTLEALGYTNIFFLTEDGTKGWPEKGPFEGIMVTAGAPEIPKTLLAQLAEGGRLVIPVGPRYTQTLYKVTHKGNRFQEEDITGCVFVPLLGAYGWKEE
jgi:protein-L-isoaspartate(D-aspartate) O-methyltransferase